MSSWNDVTKKVRGMRKNFAFRCAISFVAVLASALLQSYVILAFIRPAGLFVQRLYRTCDPDRPDCRAVRFFRVNVLGARCS